MSHSQSQTMIASIWPENKASKLVRTTLLLVFGACLITLAAKIKVPFWPVPMTMQSFAVMLIGAAYGRKLGVAAVMAYLAAGFAGLPVFANTPPQVAGPLYFAGPTGGFLLGYLPLAWFSGLFANNTQTNWIKLSAGAFLGNVALFVLGLAWMAAMLPAMRDLPVLYAKGLEPFILSSIIKIALMVAFYMATSRLIKKNS